ncbi:F0F1 ATP synthase subunit delta [Paenibacillus taiwanensis]|uniref:F0F1 ATP synthase subunit delta n=1 Tax=Paenibacillus taiwanensis TaxID=401638 RepID=UPI00041AB7C0|nr:F0F1 ATP synthase subunit delta [Paenibacillus taiwanensis]
MSQDTVVAKRYAKALFQLALEQQSVSEREQQLKYVVQAIASSHELELLLTTPNIDVKGKKEVLNSAFQGHVSENVVNTIQLLVERGRINILGDVLASYVHIAGEALGTADAIVTSAVALSESEKQDVAASFGRKVNRTIRVHNVVDPSIIGGIQVRIGDRLFDGSLSGKLDRMEKALKSDAR